MDVTSLPFNQFLGLQSTEVGGVPAIVLEPGPQHVNHVGTVHAVALYGVAEAASGQVLVARFPDLEQNAVALLRTSRVKYRTPGATDSPLVGRRTIDDDSSTKFCSQWESRGRATIEVQVQVTQDGSELLAATFTWFAANVAK